MKSIISFYSLLFFLICEYDVQSQTSPQMSFTTMSFSMHEKVSVIDETKVKNSKDLYFEVLNDNQANYNYTRDPNGSRKVGSYITGSLETAGSLINFGWETGGTNPKTGSTTRSHEGELNVLGGAAMLGNAINNKLYDYEGRDKKAAEQRKIANRKIAYSTANALVKNSGCHSGDLDCIDKAAAKIFNDPKFIAAEAAAGNVGALEKAVYEQSVKSGIKEILSGQQIVSDNVDIANAKLDDLAGQVANGFNKMTAAVKETNTKVSMVLHNQQKQAAALKLMENNAEKRFQTLQNGQAITYAAVIDLQLTADAIHDATIEIGQNVDEIKGDVKAMREEKRIEKLQAYFDNSSIKKKMDLLKDPKSDIYKLYSDKDREAELKNLKEARTKEIATKTMNVVNEWGNVAQTALSVLCKDCPPEISKGLEIGMAATNIAGNVLTGNYSQAIMSALGLFKKPQPSPEMQMLTQITKQLDALNENMDSQFKKTREQLFNMEEHLTQRFDIVDQKLDGINENMFKMRGEILARFSTVDNKLNFIIKQNECLSDLVIRLGSSDLTLCNSAIEAIKTSNRPVNNLEDLNDKFEGKNCRECVERMINSINANLLKAPSFFYSECPQYDKNVKLQPNYMYKFLYENILLSPLSANPSKISIASMMFIPKDVVIAASFKDSIKNFLKTPKFEFVAEDQFYRNYRKVLAFTDYILTLFPFLELYDDSNRSLYTIEAIKKRPGLSVERMDFLKKSLQNTLELIDHTIIQQSLLSGNGIFKNVDVILSKYVQDSEDFDINDAFAGDQYLNKNYATYFINKNVGYNKIKSYADRMKLASSFIPPSVFTNTSKIEFVREGNSKFGYKVFTKKNATEFNVTPIFTGMLPIIDGNLDANSYKRNLEFAIPSSIPELYEARQRVVDKLVELDIVTSKELDNPNSKFTRKDLEALLIAVKN